jgi:erythromycin esterase-like protein
VPAAGRRFGAVRVAGLVAGLVVGLLAGVAGPPAAQASPPADPVARWLARHAVPLTTADPSAGLGDLAPLRRSVGSARIVGLGESVHGAAEEVDLKFRTLRFLVERMGFRSVAWEEDWTTGLLINDYLGRGTGDLGAILRRMSGQWQSRQVAEVLRWLRSHNLAHADKVRFVGLEFYYTGPEAYDAVDAYVGRVAPARLAQLRRDLQAIRPSTPTMTEYVQRHQRVTNKKPLIEHARNVYRLLEHLPHRPRDGAHTLALHDARQILSFYEYYDLSLNDQNIYRDAHAAQNLAWWRDNAGHGDRIAYWAASPHTADAPVLRIRIPSGTDFHFASTGSYLRRWFGTAYLSIGFTFDHGTVGFLPGDTVTMPPPAPDWFEHPFGQVPLAQFAVDLRDRAPADVRGWLEAPVRTRGLPDAGPGSFTTGGRLNQWFDVIVHRQAVSPCTA